MEKQLIFEAISKVMEDVGVVGKNDTNKTQGFKYRGIDAIMNALNPAMIKHRVFCTPEVLEHTRENRVSGKGNTLIYSICKIKYRFFTTDGSFVEAVTIGEGMDSGDKATNKAMAIAFKYACFQIFCIPTEEMHDPDAESPELGTQEPMINSTQMRSITDLSIAYSDLLFGKSASDVMDLIKSKYKFKEVSELTQKSADIVINQLKKWYEKQKEVSVQ